jgi:hypothetical protein
MPNAAAGPWIPGVGRAAACPARGLGHGLRAAKSPWRVSVPSARVAPPVAIVDGIAITDERT